MDYIVCKEENRNYFEKIGKYNYCSLEEMVLPHMISCDTESDGLLARKNDTFCVQLGTGENNYIIVLYNNNYTFQELIPYLENKILVGAICDGATFMADNGYLDNISHTGNSLSHLKEKAPKYNGEWLFKEKQAIYDNNIITANGTAPLEFVREILLALNMLGGKNKVDEWYNLYKQGTFQS